MKKLLATTVTALFLLVGCGAEGLTGAGSDADMGGAEIGMRADAPAALDESAAQSAPAASDVGADEYLVREAGLGLKVDDIMETATKVRQIAIAAGGSVTNESFGDGHYGPASTIDRYGMMTISVPSEALDETMNELTQLGELRTRSSNAYSVEDEYVDVEARIATLRASIDRMRALMAQTDDIEQIVSLETALSSRQADLDSLQARLNSLRSRIDMSPITIQLTTTDDLGEPDTGFIAALANAWDAFTTSARVLVTTIGALLPWILVGGLGIWFIVWIARRLGRRSDARPAQPVATPTSTPPTSTASTPGGTTPNTPAGTSPSTTPSTPAGKTTEPGPTE